MAKYKFRVLIDTITGGEISYVANYANTNTNGFSDFYFIDTDDFLDYSTQQVHDTINNMYQATYQNQSLFTGSIGNLSQDGVLGDASKRFSTQTFLSASIVGDTLSGSIELTADPKLARYKFFGEKVCSVLGFPENIWIYPENAVISNTGSEETRIRGNLQSRALTVTNRFNISNIGSVTSDIPFRIDKQSDRWIKWVNVTSSAAVTENNLLMGYNSDTDTYELKNNVSATDTANFEITASKMNLTNNLNVEGNVGIGTANPTTPLFVQAGGVNRKVATFTGNFTDRGLEISTYRTGNHDGGVIIDATDDSHGALKFQTTSEEAMIIDSNQNVGIGTLTPSNKLVVNGIISSSANFHLKGGTGESSAKIFLNSPSISDGFFNYDNVSSEMFLSANKFRTLSHISVGGSITASGDISSSGKYYNTNQLAGAPVHMFEGSLSSSGHLYFEDDFHMGYFGGGLNFAETDVADYRLFIKEGGNIGIGTNSADHRLTVNGDVKFIGGGRPNLRFVTETDTTQIAETFAGTTDKAYIFFDDNNSSNDPGFIMHETRNVTETNEGVLHLCPSDDPSGTDYVSIHGTNDGDMIKLYTSGFIEGVTTISASGNIIIDGDGDGLVIRNSLETDAGIKFQDKDAIDTQNFEILYNCGNEDLRFKSDEVDNILKLHNTGEVICQHNPSFAAKRTASTTISHGSWTDVIFNTEHYDTTSNYNTSNGRFTSPVAGRYLFCSSLQMDVHNETTFVWIRLIKNGTAVRYGECEDVNEGGDMENVTIQIQSILDLSANDYIKIQIHAGTKNVTLNGSQPNIGESQCTFTGHLLG